MTHAVRAQRLAQLDGGLFRRVVALLSFPRVLMKVEWIAVTR